MCVARMVRWGGYVGAQWVWIVEKGGGGYWCVWHEYGCVGNVYVVGKKEILMYVCGCFYLCGY